MTNGTFWSYQHVNLTTSHYFDSCWIKLNSTLNASSELRVEEIETGFVYSYALSSITAAINAVQSITGTFLNLLVILALL